MKIIPKFLIVVQCTQQSATWTLYIIRTIYKAIRNGAQFYGLNVQNTESAKQLHIHTYAKRSTKRSKNCMCYIMYARTFVSFWFNFYCAHPRSKTKKNTLKIFAINKIYFFWPFRFFHFYYIYFSFLFLTFFSGCRMSFRRQRMYNGNERCGRVR